jgi:hypothetical protein
MELAALTPVIAFSSRYLLASSCMAFVIVTFLLASALANKAL